MKIKVLFVASEFAPGMIPFASSIINALADDGRFDVQCICTCSGNKTYRGLINNHAQVLYIDYPTSKIKKVLYKFWPFKIISAIKKIEKTENPDIVHFLTGDFSLALFAYLFSKPNYCYTVHDLYPHEVEYISVPSELLRKYIHLGYSVCMKSIHNLTTSSYKQCEIIKKNYPDKNIAFTPFPSLVTKEILSGIDIAPEILNEHNYILFFGSANKYKGLDCLIAAYSSMNCENKLVIAGKGCPYQSENSNIIRINRFILDSEIKTLFERASFVVYPYLSATMSGVLSLSSCFKKNVLLSDIPFFLENSSALTTYFKTGDENNLKQKMIEMIQKKNLPNDNSFDEIYSTKALINAFYSFYKMVRL